MRHTLKLVVLLGCMSSAFAGDVLVDLDEIAESGQVEAVGGVSSAGQPDESTLSVFAKNDYRTVVDMRTATEDRGYDEPAAVEKLGMEYVSFPISRGGITFESAQHLDKLLAESDGPVLLHCGSGNRVGALLALRASLNGANDEDALRIGREAGMTSLGEMVEKVLAEK